MNADTPLPKMPSLLQVCGTLLCGLIVCVFSLNGVLRNLAANWTGTKSGDALLALAAIPDSLYKALPGAEYFTLELLVRWVLLSLAVFVGLLLLNSVRHQTANIFVAGVGGLLLGLFALTWVSLLIFLVGIVIFCVLWLFGLLYWIAMGILAFFLWPPVLYTLLSLLLVIVAVALIAHLWSLSLAQILAWLKELFSMFSVKALFAVVGLAAAAAVVWFVVVPFLVEYVAPILAAIAAWLKEYVAPVIAWVFSALGILLLALLALVAVAGVLFLLGRLLVDQFASARVCGRDMHGAFATGFIVGAAAGLTLLVCSANEDYRAVVNAAWAGTVPVYADADIISVVYALMPGSAENLLRSLFVRASVPIFDSAALVATLFVANCSLMMGLLSGAAVEPLRRLFTLDRMPALFKLVSGAFAALIILAVDSAASQDS
jgi:hypothetical protein